MGMPGHRSTRALLALVAAVALLLVGAGPAAAHDEVVATTPAEQTSVPSPPSAVELQLTAPPQVLGTEVRVTAPDGSIVSAGEPEVLDSTVRQPLADGLPAGAYAVDYRVTSGDGHPITGSFAFTVAASAAAPSSATPAATAAAEPPTEPSTKPSTEVDVGEASAVAPARPSSSTAVLVGGALVVLVAAGVVVWRLRRRA